MKLRTLSIYTVVAAIVLSLGLAVAANTITRTTTFVVCPDTEYCGSEYFSNKNDTKTVDYTGFPHHIKVGNPDWCTNGSDNICEGGRFHPDFEKQYYYYNTAIIIAPSLLLGALYMAKNHRRKFKLMTVGIAVVALGLSAGWLTNSYFMQPRWVKNVRLHDYSPDSRPTLGTPIAMHLSIASGCTLESESITGIQECVSRSINYGGFWEKNSIIYANWLFWSGLYAAALFALLRHYKISLHK